MSKDKMDKWLREEYGVTLEEAEAAEIDDKIMGELVMKECDDLEAGNENGMASQVLDYLSLIR